MARRRKGRRGRRRRERRFPPCFASIIAVGISLQERCLHGTLCLYSKDFGVAESVSINAA